MGVSRSGYYKWKNRDKSKRDTNREKMIALVDEVHKAHKTHGYRWTAAYIRVNKALKLATIMLTSVFAIWGSSRKRSIKSITGHAR